MDHLLHWQSLAQPCFLPEQIRQLEPQIAQQAQMSLYQLMELAGVSAWHALHEHYPNAQRLFVCCGVGNNAGDGYVLARCALLAGREVIVYQHEQSPKTADAQRAQQLFIDAGGEVISLLPEDVTADVIVDALFGIGLNRQLSASCTELIERLNQLSLPIVALDVPSGLDASNGQALPVALKAQFTLCFIAYKPGLLTGQAAQYVGRLLLLPLLVYHSELSPCAYRIDHDLLQVLPARIATAHKGDCGHVLVAGGNQGYGGALRLAAEGALRSGVGLLSALTHRQYLSAWLSARPEAMVQDASMLAALAPLLKKADVLVLGPGLGQDDWAMQLFHHCQYFHGWQVWDADALNLLALQPSQHAKRVLTPHPGEAARLLGCRVADIESDRLTAARALQLKYDGIVILKGAGSIICDGEKLVIAPVGNAGMASGGMGDVLSGIIGSLLAQRIEPWLACLLAVVIHGRAAELAARQGMRGMLASDLTDYIRQLVD